MRILRQLAVRVADQHQVVAFRQQLVGQLHRRHAFRAVARAGEGDQQRRPLRSEILPRVGDDIGGAVGRHVAAGSFAQPGAGARPANAELPAPHSTICSRGLANSGAGNGCHCAC